MTIEVGNNEPATDANGEHEEGDDSAEGKFEIAGGTRKFCRIEKIKSDFPMWERLADFGGDKGPLPWGAKVGMGESDGSGGVVEQSDANFIA